MGPMQEEFVTADPEEAHAFMRAVYTENTMRIAGSRDGFRMRHTVAGAGSLSVAVLTHTMSVEHVAQPLAAAALLGERVTELLGAQHAVLDKGGAEGLVLVRGEHGRRIS